jgi:hypothetical protein
LSEKIFGKFFRRLFPERSVFACRANHSADVARQRAFRTAARRRCLS